MVKLNKVMHNGQEYSFGGGGGIFADVLVVGGGGGGTNGSAGGGGGAVIYCPCFNVSQENSIVVGCGGGVTCVGCPSCFGRLVAGGGGAGDRDYPLCCNGSGGGGVGKYTCWRDEASLSGQYGNRGIPWNCWQSGQNNFYYCGSGGGAGGTPPDNSTYGGIPKKISFSNGEYQYYGGGGGGTYQFRGYSSSSSEAGHDRDICGNGGAGTFDGGCCGRNGVVRILYPTDGTYGFSCATGGDCCYTCCGYKVHEFTSDGTFTIVS